jgi:hypothetical protein
MAITGTVHKAGSLKQTNKAHKHGQHRSKRSIDTDNKGNLFPATWSLEIYSFCNL